MAFWGNDRQLVQIGSNLLKLDEIFSRWKKLSKWVQTCNDLINFAPIWQNLSRLDQICLNWIIFVSIAQVLNRAATKPCAVFKPWKIGWSKSGSPTPGIEPGPLGWKPSILAIRPRGILVTNKFFVVNKFTFYVFFNSTTRFDISSKIALIGLPSF